MPLNKKLLVVDDELEYCSLIQEYFTGKYEVRIAHDGEEAVKLADDFLPDCILLDIKMPKMNGIDALKSIKSSHSKVKVIMVSASGSIRVFEESLKCGAIDYILKPIDLTELEDKIEAVMKIEKTTQEIHFKSLSRKHNSELRIL